MTQSTQEQPEMIAEQLESTLPLTDERIDAMLDAIDDYARMLNPYDYALPPVYDPEIRKIVRAHLCGTSPSRAEPGVPEPRA